MAVVVDHPSVTINDAHAQFLEWMRLRQRDACHIFAIGYIVKDMTVEKLQLGVEFSRLEFFLPVVLETDETSHQKQ